MKTSIERNSDNEKSWLSVIYFAIPYAMIYSFLIAAFLNVAPFILATTGNAPLNYYTAKMGGDLMHGLFYGTLAVIILKLSKRPFLFWKY